MLNEINAASHTIYYFRYIHRARWEQWNIVALQTDSTRSSVTYKRSNNERITVVKIIKWKYKKSHIKWEAFKSS